MDERKESGQGRFSDPVEKFLSEASGSLPDLKPPTFMQKLRNYWQNASGVDRVTMVLLSVLTASMAITAGGEASMRLGEAFSMPTLAETGRLIKLSAPLAGLAAVPIALTVLTFFEERFNPSSGH